MTKNISEKIKERIISKVNQANDDRDILSREVKLYKILAKEIKILKESVLLKGLFYIKGNQNSTSLN